jgi:hypothetical protein
MKYIFPIFIVLISCTDQKTGNNNYLQEDNIDVTYSSKLDTFYQDNTTKIDRITRTFFTYKTKSDHIMIRQNVGGSDFILSLNDNLKFGHQIFEKKEFENVLNFIDTIFTNPGKNLRYSFPNGSISPGYINKNSVNIFTLDYNDESVSVDLPKAAFDSLKTYYRRYLNERSI